MKEFLEVLLCNAYVNIIINLYCYANAVTLADTKTTGKRNLVFKMIFFYGFLQKLYNFRRTL